MITLNRIYLKEVMVTTPHTIGVEEPFSKVVEIFSTKKIRHLPVIDEFAVLRGIISQRDLYRITSPRKDEEGLLIYDKASLDKYVLKYVMTKEVFTLSQDDTLGKAITSMVTHKYGCIPVVDNEKHLLGIVLR